MMDNPLIGSTFQAVMNLSFTVVAVSAVFIILCGYAWKTTKGDIVALALGIILSGTVYSVLMSMPFSKSIFSDTTRGFVLNFIIFAVILTLITLILKKYVQGGFTAAFPKKIVHVVLLSIITEGLLFSQAYRLLNIQGSYDLSHFSDYLFGSEYSFLSWLAAVFIGLFITRNNS